MSKENNRVTYKENQKLFELIVEDRNRLSKYSKFFKYKNKIYESNGLVNNYYGDYISNYTYFVEITDLKKVERLKKKFKNKKETENQECQQMAREICENVYEINELINAELYRFKKDNNYCHIDIGIREEIKDIMKFYEKYKIELEVIRKYQRDKIVFIYLKHSNKIGFYKCYGNDFISNCPINIMDYDVFCEYLKKKNIPDPKLKEKYYSKKLDVDDLKKEICYLKIHSDNLLLKNKKLEKNRKKEIEKNNELMKKRNELLLENSELRKYNKVLRNKYTRFEIMEI